MPVKNEPALLVLDKNKRNLELLSKFLVENGYQVYTVSNMEEFDQYLDNIEQVDLVLVDIAGLDASIWHRFEQLQQKNTPLLVISPRQSSIIEQESISHGASGVMTKPLAVKELLGMIRVLVEGAS